MNKDYKRQTADEARIITLMSAKELRDKMIKEWGKNPIIQRVHNEIESASLSAKFKTEVYLSKEEEAIITMECFRILGYKVIANECLRVDNEAMAALKETPKKIPMKIEYRLDIEWL